MTPPRDTPPPDNVRGVPMFLARQTYRRRRLMDAARLLPALGCVLFFLPILWSPGPSAGPSGGTAAGYVFLFCAWAGLIVLAAVLSRHLTRPADPADGDEPAAGNGA